MKIKVSDYIANFFAENGVTTVFTVVGGGAMHMNDSFGHHKKITCIYNHHEQASAIAAEAYARLTGRIAAVCVTTGPGGTNAITGVIGGWLDSIPMFIISGQVKRETTIWSCPELNLRQLGDQEFDIIHSVSNMTKYSVMVTNPKEIAYHLEKALFLAQNGRMGPVWIDVPLDVQGAKIDTDDMIHFNPIEEMYWEVPLVSDNIAKSILEKIKIAKAPLILTGTGIRLGNAEEEMLQLIEKLKIPVVTAWNANDTVAYNNTYFVGMPGTVGTRSGNFAVQNCDLLLSIGCRLNIRMIGYNHFDFAKNAYKIIVDIDSRELSKPTIKPDMPIHADAKQFIQALLKEKYTPTEYHVPWLKWCKDQLIKYPVILPEYHTSSNENINPYVFMEHLSSQLNEDDRIICGNGSACVVTFHGHKLKQGQRMFTNSGCASMGYGLPAAIGAAVSDNSRRTICIDGDGSFMMNIQELATIAYNRLNIKIILLNNNGYHSIRQTQKNLFKPPFVGIDEKSGVGFPNFSKIADSFGIKYFNISSEKNCDIILNKLLLLDEPCICEVIIDPRQDFSPKSSSKILPDGSIVSPSIDDMAPFLDRDEYDANRYLVE